MTARKHDSSCDCAKLRDLFPLSDLPNAFREVERRGWHTLFACPVCGQRWRIDAWDKLQTQFMVRIPREASDWEAFDATNLHKQYLLAVRGGTADVECMHAGCKNRRAQGEVYCVDHLYAIGVRI